MWWGRDEFWKEIYSANTNGVIESEGEIVTGVVGVAANTWQGFLLKSDGKVLGVGHNFRGGNDVPAGLTNVVSVIAEFGSYWAIKADGTVARWGGEEGDQGGADVVDSLSNIVSIASAGNRAYLALKRDGSVIGFRLDSPQTEARQVTVRGRMLTNVAALASMRYTPLVLKTDGTVLRLSVTPGAAPEPGDAGKKEDLREAPGDQIPEPPYKYPYVERVAVDAQVLTNVVSLASGGGHALALKSDGTIVGWGDNPYGAAAVPAGLSNVVAIAAAENQSMALRADGTVAAWGNNSSGQASVPAGLSNVIAIASAGDFNLALTTGGIPPSVYVPPHGRLEEMERDASLVFKGRVISTTAITNAGFPQWGNSHATRLEVISVFKGKPGSREVEFLHLTHGPDFWSGGAPPPDFVLNPGESYLIFAANADKPDWLYSPAPGNISKRERFRQLMKGDPPIRTLDSRPVSVLSMKEAHWRELNLLLTAQNLTNRLYAIERLDRMSMAGRPDDRWRRSGDFKRDDVLRALLPLITDQDERVASRAISCFQVESNRATMLEPYAASLIHVATSSASDRLHLAAIRALSGTHFESVSNSLAQLLRHSDDAIRWRAVSLLTLFPGGFSEAALRKAAEDASPKVKAAAADAIGNGKIESLLPVLTNLFADPVGRQKPAAPLTLEELEAGGRIISTEGGTTIADSPGLATANPGDVHTSAGYALLNFDVGQVKDILKANLDDPGFRLQFLLKLAEPDAAPWVKDLASIMEGRRARNLKKAKEDGAPPESYMSLSGAYFRCWRLIYSYLEKLPPAQFAGGQNDRYLDVLEQAGNTGSQEPVALYELYKTKGLIQRAAHLRSQSAEYPGYNLDEFFNRVDAKHRH